MKKLFILPLLTYTCLNAQDTISKLESILSETEPYREVIHSSAVNISSTIDNFSFNNENLKPYQDSYIFIELSSFYKDNLDFDQRFKIRLKLPKLKESYRFVLETDEIENHKDYVENSKNSNNNINIGLNSSKFISDNQIKLNRTIGVKLRSSFDPFIKLEALKKLETNNELNYTISQIIKASAKKDFELFTNFNIDKEIKDNLSLHNHNQYYWQSKNKANSEFYHSAFLNHHISSKNRLSYIVDTNIDNIDSNLQIKRYSLKAKYTHLLTKWIYIDLIPENYYKREDDFKSKYAIRANLGIFFNKDSYKN